MTTHVSWESKWMDHREVKNRWHFLVNIRCFTPWWKMNEYYFIVNMSRLEKLKID